MKKYTVQEIVDGLNEALDLLSCAGPNNIMIDDREYFDRVHALQDKFELEQEEE
jgi:hypothetical protein